MNITISKNIYIIFIVLGFFQTAQAQSYSFDWERDKDGKIKKCIGTDEKGVEVNFSLSVCEQKLGANIYWEFESDQITGCKSVTSDNEFIRQRSIIDCFNHLDFYAKLLDDKKTCHIQAAYKGLYYKKSISSNECLEFFEKKHKSFLGFHDKSLAKYSWIMDEGEKPICKMILRDDFKVDPINVDRAFCPAQSDFKINSKGLCESYDFIKNEIIKHESLSPCFKDGYGLYVNVKDNSCNAFKEHELRKQMSLIKVDSKLCHESKNYIIEYKKNFVAFEKFNKQELVPVTSMVKDVEKIIKSQKIKASFYKISLQYNIDKKKIEIIPNNTKYFEGLAKKNISHVDLSELTKLWLPHERKDPKWEHSRQEKTPAKSWIHNCLTEKPLKRELDSGHLLTTDCSPKVLYSWGPKEKIDNYLKTMGKDGKWSNRFIRKTKGLFMTPSPYSTFGYGTHLQRFKVRKGVKFVFYDDLSAFSCDSFTDEQVANRIGIRTGTYFEYHACSPLVFESWSYDTMESYDEIVKDYLWMKKFQETRSRYFRYVNNSSTDIERSIDGYSHSAQTFKVRLHEMVQRIINSEKKDSKRFFYNKERKTKVNHFQADPPHRSWFDEYE